MSAESNNLDMFTYHRTVHYHETDKMGITHHSNYIKWLEEARIFLLDSIGLSFRKMEDDGIVSPVVGINIEYKHPTTYSDLIEIDIDIAKYTGVKIIFEYTIRNATANTIAAIATSTHCFVKDGRICALTRDASEYDSLIKKVLQGQLPSDE